MADVYYSIKQYSVKKILLYSFNQSLDDSNNQKSPLSLNQNLSDKALLSMSSMKENPLFYQILLELYLDKNGLESKEKGQFSKVFELRELSSNNNESILDLISHVVYLNFEDVFDETGMAKLPIYQTSLTRLFEFGIELTINHQKVTFKPFEKSGGMSKNKNLSFLNEDIIDSIRNRIMMGIDLTLTDNKGDQVKFPLSKLFKYNGLMLSDGYRINHFYSDPSQGSQPILKIVDDSPFLFHEKSVLVVRDFTEGRKGNFVTAINFESVHNKFIEYIKFHALMDEFKIYFDQHVIHRSTLQGENDKSILEEITILDKLNAYYSRYGENTVDLNKSLNVEDEFASIQNNNQHVLEALEYQLANFLFAFSNHHFFIKNKTLDFLIENIKKIIEENYQLYQQFKALSAKKEELMRLCVLNKMIVQVFSSIVTEDDMWSYLNQAFQPLIQPLIGKSIPEDLDAYVNQVATFDTIKSFKEIVETTLRNLENLFQTNTIKFSSVEDESLTSIFKNWLTIHYQFEAFHHTSEGYLFFNVLFHNKNLQEWILIYDKNSVKEVSPFDGLGLISPNLARQINEQYSKRVNGQPIAHTSFQIRMPFIKGMLHQVDFQAFFKEHGITEVEDILRTRRPVKDIEIILTESQFKAYKWLKRQIESLPERESSQLRIPINYSPKSQSYQTQGLDIIKYYFDYFNRYQHSLYITGSNHVPTSNEDTTTLNYQFLSTLEITRDEFQQLVSESQNYLRNITNSVDKQLSFFSVKSNGDESNDEQSNDTSIQTSLSYYQKIGELASVNPRLLKLSGIKEIITGAKEDAANEFSLGRLIIDGENRYLSGDLLFLLYLIIGKRKEFEKNSRDKNDNAIVLSPYEFYAPRFDRNKPPFYKKGQAYPLLRNPHVTSNEDALLFAWDSDDENNPRVKYLSHLTGLIMIHSFSFIADRLGGADYDGDMVKIINHPIYIRAVKKNYYVTDVIKPRENKKLLRIGYSHAPIIIPSDSGSPQKAYTSDNILETIGRTFFNFIGKISNQAFKFADLAYNSQFLNQHEDQTSLITTEGSMMQRLQIEMKKVVQLFVILIGLEIDSEKTGRKPIIPSEQEIVRRIKSQLDFDPTPYFSIEDAKSFLSYKEMIQNEDELNLDAKAFESKVHSLEFTNKTSNVCLLPKFYFAKETIKFNKKLINIMTFVFFIKNFIHNDTYKQTQEELLASLVYYLTIFADSHGLNLHEDTKATLVAFKHSVYDHIESKFEVAKSDNKAFNDPDQATLFKERILEEEILEILKSLFNIQELQNDYYEYKIIDHQTDNNEETPSEEGLLFAFEKTQLTPIEWLQLLPETKKDKFAKLIAIADAYKDVYSKLNLFKRLKASDAHLKLDQLMEHVFFDQYNVSRSEEVFEFIEVLNDEPYYDRLNEFLELIAKLQWHVHDAKNMSDEDTQRLAPLLDLLSDKTHQNHIDAVQLLKHLSFQGARLLPLLLKKSKLMNKNQLNMDVTHLGRFEKIQASLVKRLRDYSKEPDVVFEHINDTISKRNVSIYTYLKNLSIERKTTPNRFSEKQFSLLIESYFQVGNSNNDLKKLNDKVLGFSKKHLYYFTKTNLTDSLKIVHKLLNQDVNQTLRALLIDIKNELILLDELDPQLPRSVIKQNYQLVQSKTRTWITLLSGPEYGLYLDNLKRQNVEKVISLFGLDIDKNLYDTIKQYMDTLDLEHVIQLYPAIIQQKMLPQALRDDLSLFQREWFDYQHVCFEDESTLEIRVDKELKHHYLNEFASIYREAKLYKSQKSKVQPTLLKLHQKTYELIMNLYDQDFSEAIESFYHLTRLNKKVASSRYLVEIFGSNIQEFKRVMIQEAPSRD